MLISKHISRDFNPVKIKQTVSQALELTEKYGLSHIAIVNEGEFLGNLSKEILEENNPETKISELSEFFEFYFVEEKASLLDAVQKFNNQMANILPVLNEDHKFTGFLMLDDAISGLSSLLLITEPGSMMIIEVQQKKLSFAEISRIAESNNVRIIGMFVTSFRDDYVQVALKIAGENLASVGETFERFDYNIVYKFFKDNKENLIKDRFDQLMKYLDV